MCYQSFFLNILVVIISNTDVPAGDSLHDLNKQTPTSTGLKKTKVKQDFQWRRDAASRKAFRRRERSSATSEKKDQVKPKTEPTSQTDTNGDDEEENEFASFYVN